MKNARHNGNAGNIGISLANDGIIPRHGDHSGSIRVRLMKLEGDNFWKMEVLREENDFRDELSGHERIR